MGSGHEGRGAAGLLHPGDGGRSPGRWGSQPQVSLNRPQTWSRGGQGTGWRLRRGASPAVSQPLSLLCSPGDIPPR